jgi:hypothetical protein
LTTSWSITVAIRDASVVLIDEVDF